MSTPECDECRAIRQERANAYIAMAREIAESLQSGDKELVQAWLKARWLRTEEDVLVAEQVFPAIPLKSSERVRLGIQRQQMHYARTGHKLDLRK